MLKKLAADALGISDIGKIIAPQDYDKVASDDYIMHEDGEKIYFLIKSKTDEYCFTNLGFLHLDGESAMSSKRVLKRYDWYTTQVSNIILETAGTVDLDCEIKFKLGNEEFSIDVDKKQIEQLKDLYKALIKISQIMKANNLKLNYAKQSLENTIETISGIRQAEDIDTKFANVNEYIFEWLCDKKSEFTRKDFGEVFEKYINN